MQRPQKRLGRGLDALLSPGSGTRIPQSGRAASPHAPTHHTSARPDEAPPAVPGGGRRQASAPLPGSDVPEIAAPETSGLAQAGSVMASLLPIDSLQPNPHQPRKSIDDAGIETLATSIRRSGILQPITVRTRGDGYEIIAGERRWRAARSIGMSRVPVIIRDAAEEQMLELALVENIQREDLNPMDRAEAYREFCSRFGLRPDDVAERVGEDRSTVANYLRLLELPESVRSLVAGGSLSMGHARCLVGMPGASRQAQLAQAAVANQLSVRALEEIVRREKGKPAMDIASAAPSRAPRATHVRNLEEAFEQALQTKVSIQEGKRKGTGRIVIEYFSLTDFDRIAERLGVHME